MIYFKIAQSKKAARKAARRAAWIAKARARLRATRAKEIEKLAKKAPMTTSQLRTAKRIAAAEARRRV
jgi:hypothetical protein